MEGLPGRDLGVVVLRAVGVVDPPGGRQLRGQEPGEGIVRFDDPEVAPRVEGVFLAVLARGHREVQLDPLHERTPQELRVEPLEERPRRQVAQHAGIGCQRRAGADGNHGKENIHSEVGPQQLVLVDVDELVHRQHVADAGQPRDIVSVMVLELVGLVGLDILGEEGPDAGNPPVEDVGQPEVERRQVVGVRGAADHRNQRCGEQDCQESPFHRHLPPAFECDIFRHPVNRTHHSYPPTAPPSIISFPNRGNPLLQYQAD